MSKTSKTATASATTASPLAPDADSSFGSFTPAPEPAASPPTADPASVALTVTGPRAVAAPTASGPSLPMRLGEGMEDTLLSDLVQRRVHICQPGNDEVNLSGAKEGTFRDNLGVEVSVLTVVALRLERGQVRWGKYGSGPKLPLCKSSDALTPIQPTRPEDREPFAPICNRIAKGKIVPVCPEAKWQKKEETESGEREPPRCQYTYTGVFLDVASELPLVMRFKRTALAVILALRTRIIGLHEDIYGVEVAMGLELKTEPKRYYRPTLKTITQIADTERRARLRAMREMALGIDLESIAHDDEDDEPTPEEAPF